MKDKPHYRQAMVLVNKLYELAELTVIKRQDINDRADAIVVEFIQSLLQEERGKLIKIVKNYKCGEHKKLLASLTKEGGSLENKQ